MLTDLENNRTVKLFSDEYRSPVSAESAATGILELLGKNSGLLHLGGRESISRYDFGLLVAELYNYSSDLIEKILQLDVPMPAPRSIDVSLISKQAYSLGYKPGLLREELKRINTNLKKK